MEMKGPLGLIVAAVLGLLGVALNWFYLQGKTKTIASVSFLGVGAAAIEPGQAFQEQDFAEVKIPKQNNTDNLKKFVYLYQDRNTVAGTTATRRYQSGDLVYRADYRTAPAVLKLAPDERLIWIPVDSRSFVPELVDPGDEITFILPRSAINSPTPADPSAGGGGGPSPALKTELMGPFRIGSLGARLGSADVMRGSRGSQIQQRQVGIIVRVEKAAEGDRLEAKAMQLLERIQRSDYRNIGIALHPRRPKQ
jgi:hypothetical protein